MTQLISVERWTFWWGVLSIAAGVVLLGPLGQVDNFSSGFSVDLGYGWFILVLVIFLASVALGWSRDPSVRRVRSAGSAR
jgi:uncharacterized membrane protein YhaH (DUF805 family)